MKKEDVIHIHDGILLSHKKEQNSAIYRVVDGPRDSERVKNSEKQIFIILFICGIQKKWYRWTYLQSRYRHTDAEKKHMDTKGAIQGGWSGRLGLKYIHRYVQNRSLIKAYCIAHGTQLILCGNLNEKKIQKRRDVCIHIADSLCCTVALTQHCKATMEWKC